MRSLCHDIFCSIVDDTNLGAVSLKGPQVSPVSYTKTAYTATEQRHRDYDGRRNVATPLRNSPLYSVWHHTNIL